MFVAALALAGCGGGSSEDAAPVATPAETEASAAVYSATPSVVEMPQAEAAAASDGGGTASPAINSLAVDPGDGTVMIGSGPALFRLAPGAAQAKAVEGTLDDGTVSGNLVVRFAGPGELLASGHPQGAGSLPENLGLIRSSDHGDTWTFVDGPEADYHELEIAGKQIAAVGAESPDIVVSRDGGRTWESRTPPAPPIDVVINPADPNAWAVSTEQGTFVSSNAGESWRPRDTTFGARLVWPAPDALYSVDRRGAVRVSADGGRSWKDRGEIDGLPTEVAAGRRGELLAAVVGGRVLRSRDGGRSWSELTALVS